MHCVLEQEEKRKQKKKRKGGIEICLEAGQIEIRGIDRGLFPKQISS